MPKMSKAELLEAKSSYNAFVAGATESLEAALAIREALAEATGNDFHTDGPTGLSLASIVKRVNKLATYGKGAAFERNPAPAR